MLIFDEVKTGAKLARGGACEYFKVNPDLVCLAKSIGGGFPLAAFAAKKSIMDKIAEHKVFHAGTTRHDGRYFTSGGRVLGATARGQDLQTAVDRAYAAVEKIGFEGAHYRKDIGARALKNT